MKKDTLNSWTNDQLNDLIATNVMEIVKPDELAKHMDDSLLSCLEDADDVTRDGWGKLKHTCTPQCLRKIGIGDGPENYRFCKQHTVKDNPDPTCHQFINLPCNLCNATKNILQRARIYTPPSYDGAWDEKYSLPYFQPTRHMAPCITNALCNMSPVIPMHFIMLRSMLNHQIIAQASGVSKYILKYVAKVGKGNKAILFADGYTNNIWVGSQFLHNTKIATSAINESKAFQSKRYSSHPTGTEVLNVYCLHLSLGYPEVTTNMTFIQNNTGPFELCTQHTVKLD